MSNAADIRFLVHVNPAPYDREFFDIKLVPVYLNESGAPRNPLFGSYSNPPGVDHLDGLTIRCIGHKRDDGLYGFSAEYRDVFSADLPRAESMVKTLRALDRKLARIAVDLGNVQSGDFATYAVRVARALGATGDCFATPDKSTSSYDNGYYRWFGPDSLRRMIDDAFTAWRGL